MASTETTRAIKREQAKLRRLKKALAAIPHEGWYVVEQSALVKFKSVGEAILKGSALRLDSGPSITGHDLTRVFVSYEGRWVGILDQNSWVLAYFNGNN